MLLKGMYDLDTVQKEQYSVYFNVYETANQPYHG